MTERDKLLVELMAAVPGTCDWGGCDNNALLARFSDERGWLPVCQWHMDAVAAELAPITAVAFEELFSPTTETPEVAPAPSLTAAVPTDGEPRSVLARGPKPTTETPE